MITNYLVALLLFGEDVASSGDTVSNEGESNTDEAVLNEVHFCNLHVFIINDLIVLGRVKIPWNESV